MSAIDVRLREIRCRMDMQRLSAGAQREFTYTYDGRRKGRFWVRRSDGRLLSGKLGTNGAIAIGDRVRFTNRQIAAKDYQPQVPVELPKATSEPPFPGEVLVVFTVDVA